MVVHRLEELVIARGCDVAFVHRVVEGTHYLVVARRTPSNHRDLEVGEALVGVWKGTVVPAPAREDPRKEAAYEFVEAFGREGEKEGGVRENEVGGGHGTGAMTDHHLGWGDLPRAAIPGLPRGDPRSAPA